MPAWLAPVALGVGSLAAGLWTNAANAREAQRNRDFQERMSNTAHQREVRDMMAAGINPMLRHMGGSSTPAGAVAQMREPVSSAVATALEAKKLQADIELTQSQAQLIRTQTSDILQTAASGRLEKIRADADLSQLSLSQQREMLPLVLERARAEIEAMGSSARAQTARAVLDEAAAEGAGNLEDFERRIGEAGPWVRQLYHLIRLLKR